MHFSDFQLSQIKRFAAVSESLHKNPMLLTASGMTKALLRQAMNSEKVPDPSNETLDNALNAFTQLSIYSIKSWRITRLTLLSLVLGIGYGLYVWQRAGMWEAILIVVITVVLLFLLNTLYGYFAIRPIKKNFNLTDEEVVFALNDIVADPRWQINLIDQKFGYLGRLYFKKRFSKS